MILIDITSYVDSNLYNYIRDADDLKPLMCQAIALSKVKVTLCEHAPRLPAVSLSDRQCRNVFSCCACPSFGT